MKKTAHHLRIVIKVGTRTLSDGGNTLNRPRMIELVRQSAHLHAQGHELLLVSSGAVFAGREALGAVSQLGDIPFKQTMAAVGQVRLMAIYEQIFGMYGINIAQALLTHADLVNRECYLNAPKLDPNAALIQEVTRIDDDIRQLAGGSGSSVGTGGMATKIEAAEMATRSGTQVIIAPGREPDVLLRVTAGERLGTRFQPSSSQVESRKRWILAEPPRGEISVDEGAAEALLNRGKSLLAVGVTGASGAFQRGQTVRLLAPNGREIARGITHYNDQALMAIRGRRSDEIARILDQAYGSTVVHRDDMVLV
jgi:glutamate 5-kinase